MVADIYWQFRSVARAEGPWLLVVPHFYSLLLPQLWAHYRCVFYTKLEAEFEALDPYMYDLPHEYYAHNHGVSRCIFFFLSFLQAFY